MLPFEPAIGIIEDSIPVMEGSNLVFAVTIN